MRLARLAGPATLTLALIAAPLAVESQPTSKPVRLGLPYGASPQAHDDPIVEGFPIVEKPRGNVLGEARNHTGRREGGGDGGDH